MVTMYIFYKQDRNINAMGDAWMQILIDNKQHYKVFGKDVDLESLITLDVEDGKVVRHQDW